MTVRRPRPSTVLLAVGLALVLAGVVTGLAKYRVYTVLSDSMTETLHPGDRLLADRGDAGGEDLRRGDVVMLDPTAWPDDPEHSAIVKRVVGIGGDRLSYEVDSGRLEVNGTPVDEDYLAPDIEPSDQDFSVDVGAGEVFVLGDNRQSSVDSRPDRDQDRGPAPADAVTGRVVAVAFPPGHGGTLEPTATFDDMQQARDADRGPVLVVLAAGVGILVLLAAVLAHARERATASRRDQR